MWSLDRTEAINGGTLLFFTKNAMERNTMLPGVPTEAEIQALITLWEEQDAAQVEE